MQKKTVELRWVFKCPNHPIDPFFRARARARAHAIAPHHAVVSRTIYKSSTMGFQSRTTQLPTVRREPKRTRPLILGLLLRGRWRRKNRLHIQRKIPHVHTFEDLARYWGVERADESFVEGAEFLFGVAAVFSDDGRVGPAVKFAVACYHAACAMLLTLIILNFCKSRK